MAGMNKLSMRPGFARGPPARLPWMNVYSKPGFAQKYNVLPDIAHARKEMEDDLEDNIGVNKVNMQHEFSEPRSDVRMKDPHNTTEPNMVRHLENSAGHFQEGLAHERGGMHYGHESRIGPANLTNATSPCHQEFHPMKFPNNGMSMNIIGSKSCIDRTFITDNVQDLTLYGKKSVLPGISRKSHVEFEKPASLIKRAQPSNSLHAQVPDKPDVTLINHKKVYREPGEFIEVEAHEENPGSIFNKDHYKTEEDNKDHSKTEEDAMSKSPDFSVGLISDNFRNNCRQGDDVELDSKLSYSTSSTIPEHQQGHIIVETEKWAAILTEEHVEKRHKDDINYQISGRCISDNDNKNKRNEQDADDSRHLSMDATDSGNGIGTGGSPRSNSCNHSQSLQQNDLNSTQAKCDESNEYRTVLDSFTQRFNTDPALLEENVGFKDDFPEAKARALEVVYDSRAELKMQCQESKEVNPFNITDKTETERDEIKDSGRLCADDRHKLGTSTLNFLNTDEGGLDIVNDTTAQLSKQCQRDEEKGVIDMDEKQEGDMPTTGDSKRLNEVNEHSYTDLEKQKVIAVNPESVQRQHRKRKSLRENLPESKVCISQNEVSSKEPNSKPSTERKPENGENGQCKVRTDSVLYETDDDIDNISDSILDDFGDNKQKSVEQGNIDLARNFHCDAITHDDTVVQDRHVAVTDNIVDTKPLKKVTFANKIEIYDIKPVETSDMEHSESAAIQSSTGDDTYNTDSDIDQISDRILDDDCEVKLNNNIRIKEKEQEKALEVLETIETECKSTKFKPEDINPLEVNTAEEESRACNASKSYRNCDKITQDERTTALGKHRENAKEVINESNEESKQKETLTSSVTPVHDTDFDKVTKNSFTTRIRKRKKSVKRAIKNKSNDKSRQNEEVSWSGSPRYDKNHGTYTKTGHSKKVRKHEKIVKKTKNGTSKVIQRNEKINTLAGDDKGESREKHVKPDNYVKKIKINRPDSENLNFDVKKNCAQRVQHENRFSVRQNNNHYQNSFYCHRIKSPIRSEIYMKIMNILETKIGREGAAELMRSKTIKDMLKAMTKEPMRYGLSYAYIVKFREENIYLDLNKLIDDPTRVYNPDYSSQLHTPAGDWSFFETDTSVEFNQTALVNPNPTNINHSAETMKTTRYTKEKKQIDTKSNDIESGICKKKSKLKSFLKKFICVCSSRVDNDDEL